MAIFFFSWSTIVIPFSMDRIDISSVKYFVRQNTSVDNGIHNKNTPSFVDLKVIFEIACTLVPEQPEIIMHADYLIISSCSEWRMNNFSNTKIHGDAVAHPGFLRRGGVHPWIWGKNLLFGKIFAENGQTVGCFPPDPPMRCSHTWSKIELPFFSVSEIHTQLGFVLNLVGLRVQFFNY